MDSGISGEPSGVECGGLVIKVEPGLDPPIDSSLDISGGSSVFSRELEIKVDPGMDPTLDCSSDVFCESPVIESGEMVLLVDHGMDPMVDCSFTMQYDGQPNERCEKENSDDPLGLGEGLDSIHSTTARTTSRETQNPCTLKRKVDPAVVDPKKFRLAEPDCITSSAVPPLRYTKEELDRLLIRPERIPKTERAKNPNCHLKLVTWGEQFLAKLHEWAKEEFKRNNTLSFFRLRMESAKVAREMDKPSFRLDEEWFQKFRFQWGRYFRKGIRRKCPVNNQGDEEFYNILVKWYDEKSSQRLMPPGELERHAVATATTLGFRFEPGKAWMKDFIDKAGLYCIIGGFRRLYLKPPEGMLQDHYEVAFHEWYYHFPSTLNRVEKEKSSMDVNLLACLKYYLFAVIEKRLEESETSFMIPVREKDIAERLCGKSKLVMDLIAKWQRQWCAECSARVTDIRTFNEEMAQWYCERLSDHQEYVMNSERLDDLVAKSKSTATRLGIAFTQSWLRRFFELSGFQVSIDGQSVLIPPEDLARLSDREVLSVVGDVMNRNIQGASRIIKRIILVPQEPVLKYSNPELEEALEEMLKAWILEESYSGEVRYQQLFFKASYISISLEIDRFITSHRWLQTFMEKHGFRRVVSNGYSVVLEGVQPKGPSEDYSIWTTNSNEPDCLETFELDVSAWYLEAASISHVPPGDVERMAYEIALERNITGFVPTKSWLSQFISRNGLHFVIQGKRELIPKPNGLFEHVFEAEFESWYQSYTGTSCKNDFIQCLTDLELTEETRYRLYRVFENYLAASSAEAHTLDVPVITEQDADAFQEVEGCFWNKTMNLLEFDAGVHQSYSRSSKAEGTVPAGRLNTLASTVAEDVGLEDFKPTKIWTKRFIERYGIISSQSVYRFDVISSNADSFDDIFNAWYALRYSEQSTFLNALKQLPEEEKMAGGRSECFLFNENRNQILAGFPLPELMKIVSELRGVQYQSCSNIPFVKFFSDNSNRAIC